MHLCQIHLQCDYGTTFNTNKGHKLHKTTESLRVFVRKSFPLIFRSTLISFWYSFKFPWDMRDHLTKKGKESDVMLRAWRVMCSSQSEVCVSYDWLNRPKSRPYCTFPPFKLSDSLKTLPVCFPSALHPRSVLSLYSKALIRNPSTKKKNKWFEKGIHGWEKSFDAWTLKDNLAHVAFLVGVRFFCLFFTYTLCK